MHGSMNFKVLYPLYGIYCSRACWRKFSFHFRSSSFYSVGNLHVWITLTYYSRNTDSELGKHLFAGWVSFVITHECVWVTGSCSTHAADLCALTSHSSICGMERLESCKWKTEISCKLSVFNNEGNRFFSFLCPLDRKWRIGR